MVGYCLLDMEVCYNIVSGEKTATKVATATKMVAPREPRDWEDG